MNVHLEDENPAARQDVTSASPRRSRISRRVLFGVLLPVLAAIFGAIVQGNAESYFKRPKLSIQSIAVSLEAIDPISEIQSPLQGGDEKQVSVPPTLVTLSTQSDWMKSFDSKMRLAEYLEQLREGKKDTLELVDSFKQLEESETLAITCS